MDEHMRVGHEFRTIVNHTTYSFGIDDQEFMTAFECDEPADFMHLMLTLRESEASRYTERDTPIFVGQHVAIRAAPRRARRRRQPASRPRPYVCWSRQARHMAKPRSRRRARTRAPARPAGRSRKNDAERDHDQQRAAVERELRPRRPRLDVLAPVAPEQVDEERDREEERDLRRSGRATASVT